MAYSVAAMRRADGSILFLVLATMLATLSTLACQPERPPAPRVAPPQTEGSQEAVFFEPKESGVVLTYAGERGAFTDGQKLEQVPEASRGMVRVTIVGGVDPPPGQVWVANLRSPEPDGRYRLSTVPRSLFEELALGQGLSSHYDLPDGLEPPAQVDRTQQGEVIVYKTAWCGVCKKLEAYLEREHISYQAKDVEKDPQAAAELQAKAAEHGVQTGSVPVIDIGGELIVGFDRARIEKLLAR